MLMRPSIAIITVSAVIATIVLVPTVGVYDQQLTEIQREHKPFEEQYGNPTQTHLLHDGAILILNQTTDKLQYRTGESIAISTELVNYGNRSVDIGYWPPLVVSEIKNQDGQVVWPAITTIGVAMELHSIETIKAGEHLGKSTWDGKPPSAPKLYAPGRYTVESVALFTFNIQTNSYGIREPVWPLQPLWSKPLQITVLPES
jgi:hypothetical protein